MANGSGDDVPALCSLFTYTVKRFLSNSFEERTDRETNVSLTLTAQLLQQGGY